jgi:hypothetical protein
MRRRRHLRCSRDRAGPVLRTAARDNTCSENAAQWRLYSDHKGRSWRRHRWASSSGSRARSSTRITRPGCGPGRRPVDSAFLLSRVIAQCLNGFQPLDRWRSVVVAGASFPPNLSSVVEHNSYALLPRIEGQLWLRVQAECDNRRLVYSDYGVVCAAPQPGFRGAANLRYSMLEQWFVQRGFPPDKAPRDDYLTLASDLMSQESVWKGGGHCPGCSAIARGVADGKPGNATQWRETGFAHHFAVVSESLAA